MFKGLKHTKIFAKLILVLFCVSIFLPGMPLLLKGVFESTANAEEDGYTISDAVERTVSYYVYNNTTLIHMEETWGLNRLKVNLGDENWQLPAWEVDLTPEDTSAYTYASTILGLISTGGEPDTINTLVDQLVSKQDSESGSFGPQINDTYWAIIALEEAGGSYNKVGAFNYLISQQNDVEEDEKNYGGFAFSQKGLPSGADTTGAALLALSTFSETEETPPNHISAVSDCIEMAVNYLNRVQMQDGAFGYGGNATAESTAYAIIGLVSNGVDITAAEWQKDGKTMIDALISFQFTDGSFRHVASGFSDSMATRQAMLALSYLVEDFGAYTINEEIIIPGEPNENQNVIVRVEGHEGNIAQESVTAVSAWEALQAAVGEENIDLDLYGSIASIKGETGKTDIVGGLNTYWTFYVIRDGVVDPSSLEIFFPDDFAVKAGDEVVFYIGCRDIFWVSKTYFPVVEVTPEQCTPGTEVLIKISAQKYDMLTGLGELSIEEKEAIGEYTVQIGEETYQTTNGEVRIPGLEEGEVEYTITNFNPAGYPNVVAYRGVINVSGSGGNGQIPVGTSVRVAVVDKAGMVIFGPSTVKLTPEGSPLTALAATGLSYTDRGDGYVNEIAGQYERELGSESGWKYKVNDIVIDENAKHYILRDGDRLIWFYAKDANDQGPSWSEVQKFAGTGQPLKPEIVPEKTGDELVEEQITNEDEVVISLEEREKPSITFSKATFDKLTESNKPLIIKNAGAEICFEPQNLMTEEILEALGDENSEIGIEVRALDSEQANGILDEVTEHKNGRFEVQGKIFEFSFKILQKNSDESIVEQDITKFKGLIPIKIDLSEVMINEDIKNNLTAIRYELDEKGNLVPIKLGGNYDVQEKAFTFYTDSFSLYGVVKARDLTKISLGVNKPVYFINGSEGWAEVPPTILNDRTMVPIRLIAEGLGAQVEWLEESRSVTINSGSKTLSFVIGQLLEGMDTPATILNFRTMVPLRYVSENLGARVMWFSDTRRIEIIK